MHIHIQTCAYTNTHNPLDHLGQQCASEISRFDSVRSFVLLCFGGCSRARLAHRRPCRTTDPKGRPVAHETRVHVLSMGRRGCMCACGNSRRRGGHRHHRGGVVCPSGARGGSKRPCGREAWRLHNDAALPSAMGAKQAVADKRQQRLGNRMCKVEARRRKERHPNTLRKWGGTTVEVPNELPFRCGKARERQTIDCRIHMQPKCTLY